MVATIKSEFNPNLGTSIFNHAQLSDEEYEMSKTPDFVPFLFTRFVPYFFNAAH